jgi:hypothetical protein
VRAKRAARGVTWTRQQYEDYCQRTGTPSVFRQRRKRKSAPGRTKTKTEAEFEALFHSQNPGLSLRYQPFALQIDPTCFYTPDYFCPETNTVYEIKGPWVTEDSIIKFKACRRIYSELRFEMWQKKHGVWKQIKRMPDGKGIARQEVRILGSMD